MKKKYSFVPFILFAISCTLPSLWGVPPEAVTPPAWEISPFVLPFSLATDTPTPSATPTATQTATITPTETITITPTETPIPTDGNTPTPAPPSAAIERVIIVSYDGLRGDAVLAAPMTNVMTLMQNGAYSLTALTIKYAVTLPAHASMLSGMCQNKHGVDWDTTKYYLGYSKGTDIFDLAHAAGLNTAMIVNKEKMRQLAEPETTDYYELVYGIETTIMQHAIDQLSPDLDLMFIHFGSPDNRGHKYGWMSGSYLKAVRNGDSALGNLLAALDEKGLRESTLIIITADHGGHDRGHVGSVIEDLHIPWVVSGPGIKQGQLGPQVHTTDTAATVAYVLELPIPEEWDGTPMMQIFGLPNDRVSATC